MQLIDNLLILLLICGAFVTGLYLSGRYYKKLLSELQWILKVMTAEKGLGYIAQPEEIPTSPISQSFMDHLRQHGRATTALRVSKN